MIFWGNMRYDLVVRSRRAVLPEGTRPAAVAVSGAAIAAIADYGELLEASQDVDLGELALLPGLVDTHVHVNEPGRTDWEGFETATRAAAAGGVTTICDMPLNSLPPTVSVAALAEKRAAAARVAVANPSHSVRPGSLTCTCVSTSPGSSARSPRSTSRAASSGAS